MPESLSSPKTEDISYVDRAYGRILELIEGGEFAQTDVLSHRQLAERLGMSRLPVATALDRLEREGVVESAPRVGTRLKPADAEAFWGAFQWRVALECRTARLAAEWTMPEEYERLRRKAREVDEHKAGILTVEFTQVDIEFHTYIADLSHCAQLRSEIDRLGIYGIKFKTCEAVRAAHIASPERAPDHRELAEAIISGDPDRAETAMRKHLENSRTYGFLQWYQEAYAPKAK